MSVSEWFFQDMFSWREWSLLFLSFGCGF